jgi:formylmethanofuran dehydrogenase subunit E
VWVQQLQIQEEIGRGAYGVVHRGTWKSLRVTVKTILFRGQPHGSNAALEYANAAMLSAHPNIIKTFYCEVR